MYHPLRYARAGWRAYLARYGGGTKRTVFVGMNPGPFGMAQTGVPFGAVGVVRDWLGIEVPIGRPAREHPRRPVEGFACRREEVSGARLWGWLRGRFGAPERCLGEVMVVNLCPLMWLDAKGANLTPDRLRADERRPLLAACHRALARLVAIWRAELVVGVGAFAAREAAVALGASGPRIGQILHPSPASPLANRGFAAQASRQMAALDRAWR